jgi:hypothetical protein
MFATRQKFSKWDISTMDSLSIAAATTGIIRVFSASVEATLKLWGIPDEFALDNNCTQVRSYLVEYLGQGNIHKVFERTRENGVCIS